MRLKKSSTRPKVNAEALYRSEFARRLKQATENYEIADLAAKIDVTPATLYRWLNAKYDPSLAKLSQLADAMDVSFAWLVTGQGPIDSGRAHRHGLLEGYGVGDFESADGKAEKPPLAFYEPWLFELLYGPPDEPTLFGGIDMNSPALIEVREDSMEPTFGKGDLLLIDRSFGVRPAERERALKEERSPHDGIYAFRAPAKNGRTGRPIVRRIQYRLDGNMVIKCDNRKYPEEVYALDSADLPVPFGRIVWHAGPI